MPKTIVITGAGSGLGRAMARTQARRGDRVVLFGRTFAKIAAVAEEIGQSAIAIACDVADPNSVDAAFAAVRRQCSTIDALVNNAGVFVPSSLADATNSHISITLNTNLAGPIFCSRAAVPLLTGGGHIVNIGSETVVEPVAMLGLYQSTKAALERFSRTLKQELAPAGIRVTLVRAGKMVDEDSRWNVEPDVARRYVEENRRIGVDNSKAAISHFDSVAEIIPYLLDLPADLHIPEMMLEARHI